MIILKYPPGLSFDLGEISSNSFATDASCLNLENIRQVHVMEPYWHEIRIEQVIGRAIRFCSHKNLPLNERYVDIL